MSYKALPFIYIDSAGVFHFEQEGVEPPIERITVEQDADLGSSFARYTITGVARIGSPDSRVYKTKDDHGRDIPTKPNYSPLAPTVD